MTDKLWLDKFIDVYSKLGTDNLHLLQEVYHEDIKFTDPMHTVAGIESLLEYFDNIYSQINSCSFDIQHVMHSENEAAIYWEMTFSHKRLNNQQPIAVQGHSQIKAKDDSVIFHRDYFDLGVMLYEHLPLLGSLIKYIKNRASK